MADLFGFLHIISAEVFHIRLYAALRCCIMINRSRELQKNKEEPL